MVKITCQPSLAGWKELIPKLSIRVDPERDQDYPTYWLRVVILSLLFRNTSTGKWRSDPQLPPLYSQKSQRNTPQDSSAMSFTITPFRKRSPVVTPLFHSREWDEILTTSGSNKPVTKVSGKRRKDPLSYPYWLDLSLVTVEPVLLLQIVCHLLLLRKRHLDRSSGGQGHGSGLWWRGPRVVDGLLLGM